MIDKKELSKLSFKELVTERCRIWKCFDYFLVPGKMFFTSDEGKEMSEIMKYDLDVYNELDHRVKHLNIL